MQPDIKIINYFSNEYFSELALRSKVLREPLNLNFTLKNIESENIAVHIGGFYNDVLIGCLVLKPININIIQMTQVAVEENFRGKGLGKMLVIFSEEHSKKLGFSKMNLHARIPAIKFYEKLGYKKDGEEFIEVSIPHWEMSKNLK